MPADHPSGNNPAYRLLTFAPMVDSELSRLVLAHYAIPHQEERHIFGWASILALRHAWTPQVPVLYGGGLRLAGPRGIVDEFDQRCPPDRKLIPARQPLGSRVEADWDRFNGDLATETAVFAYFHLLPHPDIMIEPLSDGLPAAEARALRGWAYTPLRQSLTLLLRLSAARAADALERIQAAFAYTEQRLSDGRAFMTGNELTLSDLALAAAVAPLLQPTGYGAPMPAVDAMPQPMRSAVGEFRSRPAARFIQRVYDTCKRG
jgi:glutathione S-transferase